MDFVANKRLVWAFAATVATALGLTVGSAVLAERADAACPPTVPQQALEHCANA
jgi:hypothetical protein